MSQLIEPMFNTDEYQIPFPQIDGRDVADLAIRIGGNIKLNRNDPEHAAFMESLILGRHLQLTFVVSVDGKHHNIKGDSEDETIAHVVILRVHGLVSDSI